MDQPTGNAQRTRLLTATLVLALGFASAAFPQQGADGAPDLATMEAQLEEAFQKALEIPDDEPLGSLQAWGAVIMEATILERRRSMAEAGEGEVPAMPDSAAVAERVLARWQRLRPEAGGPDLFRALQIAEPSEKRAAVIALLDRFPHDPLVVWQATNELRSAGETARAREVLEAFAAGNPDRPIAYRFLAQDARDNETRLAEVLERWASAIPGDPDLVGAWMVSSLARQEPEATERVLRELFERRPTGDAGLRACLSVLERGSAAFTAPARACVARIAGDPEAPAHVAARATSALVGMAAADGDWSSLLAALDAVEPRARVGALIAAARQLQAPTRCAEAIDLLTVASEALEDDGNAYASVASALHACAPQPAAQELFLALLQAAPADAAPRIVNGWVSRVNGAWSGELPRGTAGALERRQQREPDAPELFRALDVVYQVAGEGAKRFDLLRRWQQLPSSSFDGDRAIALASGLVERGETGAAMEVLERQLESRFEPEVVEVLWALYLQADGEERAERFATDLIAGGQVWRVRAGHHLAARSALVRGDFGAAEGHYWKVLESDFPSEDVAIELLAAIAWRGDRQRLEPTARRICEEAKLDEGSAQVPACAADLLARAGSDDIAADVLSAHAANLPEDLETLRALSSTARSAGQTEVAERALRRILETDPRNEASWTGLAGFLEQQGRADEAAELLERSREYFSPPPLGLYRAAARALAAAGQPRRAIDLLIEARRTLPETEGGEWGRSWIDHELREAYGALGKELVSAAPGRGAAPRPSFATSELPELPSDATAPELRAAAAALQSGAGGRYDPVRARVLYARAADQGDVLATFRIAVLQHFDPSGAAPDEPPAEELYHRSAKEVEALASQGDAFAQYLVGTAALGLAGPPDPTAARRWLERAAAQGESWAWHNLGWMQETGQGLPGPDLQASLASYRRASEEGNTQSMVALARLTLTWDASGPPCQEGLRWLERAAHAGNAAAASFLGKLLFYGRGKCVARDPEAARSWLEAAAATHRPGGGYDLGLSLVLTGGNATARARGLSLLEEAARGPGALGAETLAWLHATGIGLQRDPPKARRLTNEAARLGSDGFPRLREEARRSEVLQELLDEGIDRLEVLAARSDPAAAALLARLYALGLTREGSEVAPERTVALAQQAAAAGEALAMRVLADAYLSGDGVEKDAAEGRRWRRRCAEAGDSFCMMFLGNDLMKGEGVERDLEAGLAWLRRSAEAGNWWATADLGHLYDEGWYGLPNDPDEAAAWKHRLADLGDPEAAGWLLYNGYR